VEVLDVCKVLESAGYQAWLAGGCVRDAILGVVPQDFDIATSATPDQIQGLFPKSIDVGKAFGVIILPFKDFQIEVATFRKDLEYVDARRPSGIAFSKPQEDAKRRDFTVNALFFDITNDKVVDFVSGLDDLKKKILRAVGDPVLRFSEDHLRILRALRFAAQLDFEIEEDTLDAIRSHHSSVSTVSKERIRVELLKLFKAKSRMVGVGLLESTGVLLDLFPDMKSFIKSKEWKLTKKNLGQVKSDAPEYFIWALFFLYFEKDLRQILKDLKCSSEVVEKSFKLATNLHKMIERKINFVGLRKIFSEMGPEILEMLRVNGENDPVSKTILKEVQSISCEPLPARFINGGDLQKLGFKAGPLLGKVLEEVFDLQIENKLKSREEALSWIKLRG